MLEHLGSPCNPSQRNETPTNVSAAGAGTIASAARRPESVNVTALYSWSTQVSPASFQNGPEAVLADTLDPRQQTRPCPCDHSWAVQMTFQPAHRKDRQALVSPHNQSLDTGVTAFGAAKWERQLPVRPNRHPT